MAAESGKIDPMHQFEIQPIVPGGFEIAGQTIAFTNSALWMLLTLIALWVFMQGGMRRELVPGRWDPNLPLPAHNRSWSSDWTAVDFG